MTSRIGSDQQDASTLGEPLHYEFANRTAPNRFLKAAMTERLSSWDPKDLNKRGIPSPELINVYKRWGEGGLGTILTGNIMIDLVNLEAPGNIIIPKDAPFSGPRFDAFKQLASEAKAHGSLVIGQVSHPGRQVGSGLQPDPVSASDIQLEKNVMGMSFAKPHAASLDEIKQIIASFTHAAEFLHKAGYDGIELHGAHGYLLAQFLSSTTNKRTDDYGGSLPNRSRIISEVAQSIRQKLPTSTGFILGIKINSVEFQEGGFSTSDCRDLCSALEKDAQFDFVELSGGTYESLAFSHQRESTKKREAFFLDFADQITPSLHHTRTFVTGGLRTVSAMKEALNSVDGIGLARPVCAEPHLALDILSGKVITGAKRQKLDESDFGATNIAAGTQIRQIGRDQEPMDLTTDENLKAYQDSVQKWMQAMTEDGDKMEKYGYVDVEGVPLVPYGTVE